MYRYKLVAMGGTFDILHKGHVELLRHAFNISESVIIGVTTDTFAAQRGKCVRNSYKIRIVNLKKLLKNSFPRSKYKIRKLQEDFGPTLYTKDVEALVVSKETKKKGAILNKTRGERGLPAVDVITVDLVLAKDGKRISSTRIKSGEIDREGNFLKHSLK